MKCGKDALACLHPYWLRKLVGSHRCVPRSGDGTKGETMVAPITKNKGGRPPITTDDLPNNWKEIIIHLSAQGYSAVEIRAELCLTGKGKNVKFHQQVWDALQKREEEFSCTINIGKQLCEAWWTAQGRESLKAQNFQTGLWYANMKNRFKWADKREGEGIEIKNYVQIYRPERESKKDVEASCRPTNDSIY